MVERGGRVPAVVRLTGADAQGADVPGGVEVEPDCCRAAQTVDRPRRPGDVDEGLQAEGGWG